MTQSGSIIAETKSIIFPVVSLVPIDGDDDK
jgi:hypothetical protein